MFLYFWDKNCRGILTKRYPFLFLMITVNDLCLLVGPLAQEAQSCQATSVGYSMMWLAVPARGSVSLWGTRETLNLQISDVGKKAKRWPSGSWEVVIKGHSCFEPLIHKLTYCSFWGLRTYDGVNLLTHTFLWRKLKYKCLEDGVTEFRLCFEQAVSWFCQIGSFWAIPVHND